MKQRRISLTINGNKLFKEDTHWALFFFLCMYENHITKNNTVLSLSEKQHLYCVYRVIPSIYRNTINCMAIELLNGKLEFTDKVCNMKGFK